MNSKKGKPAVAVVILATVLAGICFLELPLDGAHIALAEMRDAISHAPWMHVVVDIDAAENSGRIEEWMGFERSLEISKRPDGTIHYRDAGQDTLTVYAPELNTVTVSSLNDQYAVPRRTSMPTSADATVTALLDSLQDDGKATVAIDEDQMEDRAVRIVHVQRPLDEGIAGTEDVTIVIDAVSKLPISMDMMIVEADGSTRAQAHATFDYPQEGPTSIHSLGVPDDVTVIDRRPRPETAANAAIDYHVVSDPDAPNGGALLLYGAVNIDLVQIPAGEFLMGCPETEIGYPSRVLELFARHLADGERRLHPTHEEPQHRVQINQGFYMSQYEITCGQFRRFRAEYRRLPHSVGALDGKTTRLTMDADDQPACVSLEDALAFCAWISEKTGLQVRLPSEAEWEYACRAGTETRFYWGDSEEETGHYANVADRTYERAAPRSLDTMNTDDGNIGPAPVGQYRPNSFDLYDMIGNVPEWVQGIYGANAQSIDAQGKQFDPNAEDNQLQYSRGGSWQASLTHCRCAARWTVPEDYLAAGSTSSIGFRILIQR